MSSSQTSARNFLDMIIPEVRLGGARNIVELAKSLGTPVETTRYKVKGMLRRGLKIDACLDFSKFGLVAHYAHLDLTERTRANEKKFFKLLADHGYLASCARRLPGTGYACRFLVPAQKTGKSKGGVAGSLTRLLRILMEEKLLQHARAHDVSWEKNHMIQPEYFDLKRGSWKIDWVKLRRETNIPQRGEAKAEGENQIQFDELDLMIARELESDALARLSDIAGGLRTTLNNIFYHFHKHVLEGKYLEEFVLRWSGTQKQPTVCAQFEFEGLSVAEEKTSRNILRRIPYLWSDALSTDTGFYTALAMIPQEQYLETLYYLSSTLGETAQKLEICLVDSRTRQVFPLPVHLYKDSMWRFDPEESARQITSRLRR